MKRSLISLRMKMYGLTALAVGSLLLCSCAKDGYDDESFTSDVTNSNLSSPLSDSITVSANADGSKFLVTWPVVVGAGGYLVSFYDTSTPDAALVKDSLIDGCSVTLPREEDTNYKLVIATKGNTKYNNTDATEASEKTFSTFAPTYQSIPDGTDLYTYFTNMPVPSDTTVNYDLVAGGNYTCSGPLNFGSSVVTLRTNDKTNRAQVQFTAADAGFVLSNGCTLKYINFNCSQSGAGFLSMSTSPAIPAQVVNAWGTDYNFYFVNSPITVLNCNVEGLNSFFFWDSKTAVWLPTTLVVKNCLVHCTSSDATNLKSGAYFWTNKGSGYIRNLSITNSTFYNTGELEAKYFVQYGGFGQSQTSAFGWADNTITYDHDTFYNMCASGQWGNYNGIAGKGTSYWNMTNCIFYNCSSGATARRFLAGKQNQSTAVFNYNTYEKSDGTFESPSGYDNSGTQIEEDPGFKDAANGDFTISASSKQNSLGTGDPRWISSKN